MPSDNLLPWPPANTSSQTYTPVFERKTHSSSHHYCTQQTIFPFIQLQILLKIWLEKAAHRTGALISQNLEYWISQKWKKTLSLSCHSWFSRVEGCEGQQKKKNQKQTTSPKPLHWPTHLHQNPSLTMSHISWFRWTEFLFVSEGIWHLCTGIWDLQNSLPQLHRSAWGVPVLKETDHAFTSLHPPNQTGAGCQSPVLWWHHTAVCKATASCSVAMHVNCRGTGSLSSSQSPETCT